MALNQFGGTQQSGGDAEKLLSGWTNAWGLGGENGFLGSAQNTFAPSAAPIQQGFTQGQINTSYDQTQQGLGQQQAFLAALMGQNGIGNQSNVFQQQQALAQQLQMQAAGQGPNPAQAMLANSTGQNTANQAALMGSQRGAGANTGLIARQAAMQGGANQQNMAGQAAALQAQQQIAAQNALAQQQSSMANLSQNQVANAGNAQNAYNNAAQNQYGMLQNANQAYNQTLQSGYNTNNQIGAGVASQNASTNKGILGGIIGGVGSVLGGMFAQGGTAGPSSRFGQRCHGMNMRQGGNVPGQAPVPGKNTLENDIVDAKLSPGEVVIDLETLKDKGDIGKKARFIQAYLAKKNRAG